MAVAMHSAVNRMLQASALLPADLARLFADLFHANKTPEQICAERGMSQREFEESKARMLRSLRAASS